MKPTAADIAHAPDALIINHVAPGELPYDVPDGCAPNRGHRAEEGLASLLLPV
jgi:hypothetical protein